MQNAILQKIIIMKFRCPKAKLLRIFIKVISLKVYQVRIKNRIGTQVIYKNLNNLN